MKMKRIKNSGFSLLEMVIAMFIIAIVIAFSLALMGDGMRRVVKANELLTATALAQYRIDYLHNINFPPTTNDRTDELDPCPETKVDCPNSDYEIKQTIDANPPSPLEFDRKVTIKVYKKGSGSPLITLTTYISRNGAI